MLCIYRLGEYAIRVLSCTCRALSRSIGIEERRIAARPLMQLVVYDGPIVIDEPPATPSFSCQHRPCCADRQAHVQLIRVNAARRQEVWQEKQRKEALPRALPPPPLASRVPRSSGVGRGTKMPAARQVCCVRHVVSCDIVPALLSRLSGGHVANECKRRSAWSSVGRPTAKECHTPVAAKEKSHVWTRIRLSVKCTCCFVLLCLHCFPDCLLRGARCEWMQETLGVEQCGQANGQRMPHPSRGKIIIARVDSYKTVGEMHVVSNMPPSPFACPAAVPGRHAGRATVPGHEQAAARARSVAPVRQLVLSAPPAGQVHGHPMRGRHQAWSALLRLQRVNVRKCRAAERREAVLPLACDSLRALRWGYEVWRMVLRIKSQRACRS